MKQVAAAFAVLALASPAAAETETITRTVPITAGGTVDLKTFSGRVTIRPRDGDQVTVNAVRRGSRRQLDRVRLDVTSSGSTVYIDANHHDHSWWSDNVVETELDVQVPRRTKLRVMSFSAPVEVNGVDAPEIQARTFSGHVDLRLAQWAREERLDVKTFSGSVSMQLPSAAAGQVVFNSFSGKLESDLPLVLHSSSRRNLTAELGGGSGGGSIHVHTFSGGVKIQR